MGYYTCPKCGSTYELKEGLTHCPACLSPIVITKNQFDDDYNVEEEAKTPATQDLKFSKVDSGPDEGSYLIGFILGFFLSWIGLIIAVMMQKKKTFKAALIAMIVSIVLGAIFVVIYMFVFRYVMTIIE